MERPRCGNKQYMHMKGKHQLGEINRGADGMNGKPTFTILPVVSMDGGMGLSKFK